MSDNLAPANDYLLVDVDVIRIGDPLLSGKVLGVGDGVTEDVEVDDTVHFRMNGLVEMETPAGTRYFVPQSSLVGIEQAGDTLEVADATDATPTPADYVRDEIFGLIDKERANQDVTCGDDYFDGLTEESISQIITHEITYGDGDYPTRLLKVAALAVAALESVERQACVVLEEAETA